MKGVAAELSVELGRPVTFRETLLRLLEGEQVRPRDFAWSWRFKEQASAEKRIRWSEKRSGLIVES